MGVVNGFLIANLLRLLFKASFRDQPLFNRNASLETIPGPTSYLIDKTSSYKVCILQCGYRDEFLDAVFIPVRNASGMQLLVACLAHPAEKAIKIIYSL